MLAKSTLWSACAAAALVGISGLGCASQMRTAQADVEVGHPGEQAEQGAPAAAPAPPPAADQGREEAPGVMQAAPAGVSVRAPDRRPSVASAAAGESLIEVAILLDTSNSMDGLINQARTRLWAIVNELARSSKGGVTPVFRVALYEYGNNSLDAESGYIRQVVPLTDDLDRASQELFALVTNGGSEHCGEVIARSIKNLPWTPGDHYKAIFIAGNEPFTQGTVDYKVACRDAIAMGVIVNTIHCGPEHIGRDGKWDDGARLADGRFMNIDQDQAEVSIDAPQDTRLRELNGLLNATYLGYGALGEQLKGRQESQDRNAAEAAPEALVQRAAAKASGLYRNSTWDICDAWTEKKVDLAALTDAECPEPMRGMSAPERIAFVEGKIAERKRIQDEIRELSDARRAFVAAEHARLAAESADGAADTFQTAMQAMLREQLTARGFEVGK